MTKFLTDEGGKLETELLQKRVQGSYSQWSIRLEGGAPQLSLEGIPPHAQPDLTFFAEYLRSERPLTPDIRNWIADIMDPASGSEYQFKKLSLRKPSGRKKIGTSSHWDAAEYALEIWIGSEVNEQMEFDGIPDGMVKRKHQAVTKAAAKFLISQKAVEAAITDYRRAKQEHDRIARHEYERQQDQAKAGNS